jgi:hypothetical protein
MAALSITAANVAAGSDAVIESGTAGATITAGQLVYRDEADGKYKLVDCDSATAAARNPRGIALNGAANGQPLKIQRSGDITMGATLVAGTTYYAAPTAGDVGPLGDVASGDDPIIIGIAKSASVLQMRIVDPGVTI